MNTGKRQKRAKVNDEQFVPEESYERIANVTTAEYPRRSEHYPSCPVLRAKPKRIG